MNMLLLISLLAYFLDAVYGAAHPIQTLPARLEKRQSVNLAYVWSLTVSGTTTSCMFV